MEKLKTNQRKIHRKITALSAIPLLITILSGIFYSIFQPLGVDAFWLIKWHTGNFGIINLQPFYSIFLGIASIISIMSGISLLKKN
ncbi:putative Fumarate reductase subunit D [Prochlorococcus marinus str. MIT 9201]|uniref:Putative Fumarate reductase subunit D n=1 Tax=Prochlorococcus marinus str. MIT 9201 TaxID=93057 RepID=A0A0A2A9M8_PROMR|nr:fumarate reductase [Prochlorococcus marinus]KGF97229.1 putative Fumarate reductase subunit D [Prochlorococcus marinus str. MIT 9201]